MSVATAAAPVPTMKDPTHRKVVSWEVPPTPRGQTPRQLTAKLGSDSGVPRLELRALTESQDPAKDPGTSEGDSTSGTAPPPAVAITLKTATPRTSVSEEDEVTELLSNINNHSQAGDRTPRATPQNSANGHRFGSQTDRTPRVTPQNSAVHRAGSKTRTPRETPENSARARSAWRTPRDAPAAPPRAPSDCSHLATKGITKNNSWNTFHLSSFSHRLGTDTDDDSWPGEGEEGGGRFSSLQNSPVAGRKSKTEGRASVNTCLSPSRCFTAKRLRKTV